jgi:hypothetical protein
MKIMMPQLASFDRRQMAGVHPDAFGKRLLDHALRFQLRQQRLKRAPSKLPHAAEAVIMPHDEQEKPE